MDTLAALSSMIKISDATDLRLFEVESHDHPVYYHNVDSEADGDL